MVNLFLPHQPHTPDLTYCFLAELNPAILKDYESRRVARAKERAADETPIATKPINNVNDDDDDINIIPINQDIDQESSSSVLGRVRRMTMDLGLYGGSKGTPNSEQDSPQNKSIKYKQPGTGAGGSEGNSTHYMGDGQSGEGQEGQEDGVSKGPSTDGKRSSRSSFSKLLQQGVDTLSHALSYKSLTSTPRGSFSVSGTSSSMINTPTGDLIMSPSPS